MFYIYKHCEELDEDTPNEGSDQDLSGQLCQICLKSRQTSAGQDYSRQQGVR